MCVQNKLNSLHEVIVYRRTPAMGRNIAVRVRICGEVLHVRASDMWWLWHARMTPDAAANTLDDLSPAVHGQLQLAVDSDHQRM